MISFGTAAFAMLALLVTPRPAKANSGHVVTGACAGCKFTDCVDVCPVDAFHEGPNSLVINQDECIDCTLCVPECPVEAIKSGLDLTDDEQQYFVFNAEMSRTWPRIIEKKYTSRDLLDKCS